MPTGEFYNAAVDFLDRNVDEGRGASLAVRDPQRALSYRELRDAAARVAGLLARYGVQREQRIALLLFDTVSFPVFFWGAIRAGVVPVLLNTRLTAEQYRYMLEDSRAQLVLVSPDLQPVIEEAASGLPGLKAILPIGEDAPEPPDALLAEYSPGAPAVTCADEVAYWLYSSGTTGMPKGVMHVHSTPRAICRTSGKNLIGFREDDLSFSTAKCFFAYGLSNSLFVPAGAGGAALLCPEHSTPTVVCELMRRFPPTMFYAVPTLYALILNDENCQRDAGWQRVRLCFSAGEALPAHIGEAWSARFGVDIINGVGTTEMNHLFLANVPGKVEYGTAGVPVTGYELKLVDDQNTVVGDMTCGELLVRGPTAAQGYWNQRDKSRRIFEGEWTRTGDKYERRADGVYLYCGRSDDMFKVSGIWVSPNEVEAALASHPRVLEAAVIPFESSDGLLKPKAFVVLREPGDAALERALYEELKVHVKRSIGPWKYPRWIEFVPRLPRTATGKLQRYKLREWSELLARRKKEDSARQ
ncbi:MAG: benzoate-CoA ligase family protein [Gammaproteobacteria bacterium]|nr:benzoate-CoA ligase family protein [Gammaproteobacteria bacterium]